MEFSDKIFKRIAILYYIAIVVVAFVFMRIVFLQYINPDKVTAEKISFRESEQVALRGDILAHDGKILATDVPYYRIRMDCSVQNEDTFKKYVDDLARSLADFYKDRSATQYAKLLKEAHAEGKKYLNINNRLLDYSELMQIKAFPLFEKGQNRGGLIVEEEYRRTYPFGREAYRTIGYINKEGVGVGIEASCDYRLKGKDGVQIKQKIAGGEWIPVYSDRNRAPENGCDIRTTLDIDLQEAVEIALKRQLIKGENIEGATAVVMETKSGAIRAISNLKNDGRGGFDESLNYAIGQATEPGSVLKLVTLVALLEDGFVTLDTKVDGGDGVWRYLGQRVSDSHAVGMQTVKGAFAQSSNVCFAKLATTYYANDPKKFINRIRDMKVGERYNLEIQGEADAVIVTPDSKIWTPSLLASIGFGYGVLLTPLHTLTFYNAIANDGKMVKPYFIEDYERDGSIIEECKPQLISGAICSKETAKKAQEALRAVVTEGTGKMMRSDNYNISGKTGTARVAFPEGGYERGGKRKYQATFCGYFPSEAPKYSLIVVVYSGETTGNFYGASWAGPVFKEIADFLYANSTDWTPALVAKEDLEKASTPAVAKGIGAESKIAIASLPITDKKRVLSEIGDNSCVSFDSRGGKLRATALDLSKDTLVTGMGLKDALYLLGNMGFNVKATGGGRVISQSIETSSRDGESVITLTLGNDKL